MIQKNLRLSLYIGGLLGALPFFLMWTVLSTQPVLEHDSFWSRLFIIMSLPGGILEPFIIAGLEAVHCPSPIAMVAIEMLLNVVLYSACTYALLFVIGSIARLLRAAEPNP
jgi:hypothetical protein